MTKLKITAPLDDRPVKVTLDLPASIHRDLAMYATILGRENAQAISDPVKLVAPMLAKFMAADREFVRARRKALQAQSAQMLAKEAASSSGPAERMLRQ